MTCFLLQFPNYNSFACNIARVKSTITYLTTSTSYSIAHLNTTFGIVNLNLNDSPLVTLVVAAEVAPATDVATATVVVIYNVRSQQFSN